MIREADSVAEIRALWPVVAALRPHLDAEALVARVERARAAGYRLYGAWADEGSGEPLGAMGLRPMDNLAYGFHVYVDDLVVLEGARGRGVGRRLMAFADALARAWGAEVLRLESGFPRTGAHAFYERIGLPKVGYSFGRRLE